MELRYGTPAEAGMLAEQIDRARELCAHWVESGHTPAIVTVVARRGVIVLHEAFGKLRPEDDSPPVQLDTIFPIMSITKPMVATLVMQLAEDGLLGLNRPIRDYLPEVMGAGTEEVLVHHVLTFTAGWDEFALISSFIGERADLAGRSSEVKTAMRDLIHRAPLSRPPGKEMDYAFLCYELLKELVERVSGHDFSDLVEERIFRPLGMQDSYVVVPEAVRSRVVNRPPNAPFNQQMGPLAPIDSRLTEEVSSVFSTARDIAVFGQMFLNGGTYGGARVLSRAAVAAMTRNQTPGIPVTMGPEHVRKQASYGYGWFIRTHEKWKYWDGSLQSEGEFHHQGAGGVLLWVDPRDEIVGVYFSVDLAQTPNLEPLWNADLYQNVISAAVED